MYALLVIFFAVFQIWKSPFSTFEFVVLLILCLIGISIEEGLNKLK